MIVSVAGTFLRNPRIYIDSHDSKHATGCYYRKKIKPSPFTSGTAIVVYVALVRIVLFCFAGPHYGYFRDELYYLACGEHPVWGYVDQPPLIASAGHGFCSTRSVRRCRALRLLPALAGAATIALAGLLARSGRPSRAAGPCFFLARGFGGARLACPVAPVHYERL